MNRKNFSLLELLIVIGIIAILAGLLLPALHSARRKAQAIHCKGNLKQQGVMLLQYTMMFQDYMPAAEDSGSPGDQKTWCQKLFLAGLLPCKKPVTDIVNVNARYCAVLRCSSRSMENWVHYGMNPHPAGLMGIGNEPGYVPKSSYYMKIVNIKKAVTRNFFSLRCSVFSRQAAGGWEASRDENGFSLFPLLMGGKNLSVKGGSFPGGRSNLERNFSLEKKKFPIYSASAY